jgi:hypothetical protein
MSVLFFQKKKFVVLADLICLEEEMGFLSNYKLGKWGAGRCMEMDDGGNGFYTLCFFLYPRDVFMGNE